MTRCTSSFTIQSSSAADRLLNFYRLPEINLTSVCPDLTISPIKMVSRRAEPVPSQNSNPLGKGNDQNQFGDGSGSTGRTTAGKSEKSSTLTGIGGSQ